MQRYTQLQDDRSTDGDNVWRRGNMTSNKGITLTFHEIRYEVKQKLDDMPVCGKTGMKDILKRVSGYLPPGLNAIMGPTGSGKTSLLDILAQRKDPRGLKEGLVLLDNEKPPEDFRLMSGYVVQDDVVMGTLTVRENLAFSANLRLSNKEFDKQAKKEKVDHVINQLGLQACADTLVGNEFVRGVSGGERKRVNIGMEMILDPPILFLDEPTTGLDANTANSLVLLLYKLASGGRNVLMSIHQPRYSIFSLMDRLLILNKGNVVYSGPTKSAVEYFSEIGYTCPQFHNPADYFLDIVGGDVNTAKLIGNINTPPENSYEANGSQSSQSDEDDANKRQKRAADITVAMEEDEQEDNSQFLVDAFAKSSLAQEENKLLNEIKQSYWNKSNALEPGFTNGKLPETNYANGFFAQLGAVTKRTVINILRNPMTSFAQVLLMITFGVLIGLIYFQTDTSFQSGIQNRSGCFFFLITSQVMSNLSALELFIKNRTHFIHESASGYYRVSVFFIAQVFADLIPNRLVPNLFFSVIIYFMIGFQMDVGKFFFFVLTLFITAIGASSMAFFVSASVRVFAIANILVSLPYILMMLFGGFLANTESLLDWLAWLKWVSIFRYGINALTVNEMSGLVFIDNSSYPGFNISSPLPCMSSIDGSLIPNCTTGEMYMDIQGIPYDIWGKWQNIVALGCIAFGFLFFAYVQLRRVNKFK
ncbi:broad substrate specificity ATP-binding cassette transporter ABCG2-like isoform X2 [Clavelina lepadiformis]|uniref:broad substrate specificity ATP-binding cassette transporter ABCG2-like isoform X2 n=1 Tax=Clavelina lepadiformis TaxID=159417 RepID=UPI00404152AA